MKNFFILTLLLSAYTLQGMEVDEDMTYPVLPLFAEIDLFTNHELLFEQECMQDYDEHPVLCKLPNKITIPCPKPNCTKMFRKKKKPEIMILDILRHLYSQTHSPDIFLDAHRYVADHQQNTRGSYYVPCPERGCDSQPQATNINLLVQSFIFHRYTLQKHNRPMYDKVIRYINYHIQTKDLPALLQPEPHLASEFLHDVDFNELLPVLGEVPENANYLTHDTVIPCCIPGCSTWITPNNIDTPCSAAHTLLEHLFSAQHSPKRHADIQQYIEENHLQEHGKFIASCKEADFCRTQVTAKTLPELTAKMMVHLGASEQHNSTCYTRTIAYINQQAAENSITYDTMLDGVLPPAPKVTPAYLKQTRGMRIPCPHPECTKTFATQSNKPSVAVTQLADHLYSQLHNKQIFMQVKKYIEEHGVTTQESYKADCRERCGQIITEKDKVHLVERMVKHLYGIKKHNPVIYNRIIVYVNQKVAEQSVFENE